MSTTRPIVAEFVGTALLLAIIVGSGMMGERLAGGNGAIALLANSIATGAGLIVLIAMFGPLSGAHFNPVVTMVMALRRETGPARALGYVLAQTSGAIAGSWLAHAMFAVPLLQVSTRLRSGPGQGLSEAVATFGLVGTVLAIRHSRPTFTPVAVGLYIVAAYWFTASTSFANPAVTIARSLTDSFAGIAPASVPAFVTGQIFGALVAAAFFGWLLRGPDKRALPAVSQP